MKNSKPKVIISATNDLVTDNRIARTAGVLQEIGYDILLVGRKKRNSPSADAVKFKTKRMRLLFEKGPMFYAEYNIRLFLFLLFKKFNLLVSNDLDTLLPNFIISKLKQKPLVYDSHEYYTETPELIHRKKVQKTWKYIEKSIVPHLKHCITVSNGISDLFFQKYNVHFEVVRNMPNLPLNLERGSRKALNLPEDRDVILLQGAGINIDRGAEESVLAMKYVENALLLIVGSGDVVPKLKEMVQESGLSEKVKFIDRVPKEILFQYSCNATIGLSVDKDTNINYRYSLPNKLFDYIHAGLPILASNLVEVGKIVRDYNVGEIIESHDPKHIAEKMTNMLNDKEKLREYRANEVVASKTLNWETEKQVLIKIFKEIAI